MAVASVYVMELDSDIYLANTEPMLSHINVGTGVDGTIRGLAETVARVVDFNSKVSFDSSKPDGTKRILMDVSRLKDMGREVSISLEDGLRNAYRWFLDNQECYRS